MDMWRITLLWQGFTGAPGYSNFYFAYGGGLISDAQQVANRVDAFADAIAGRLPSGATLEVQSEAAVVNSDTGELVDYANVDGFESHAGLGSGGYSAASGAVINWRTNDLRGGRRIRGRTFLVPLAGNSYEADGTLASNTRSDIQAAADAMVGGDLDSELLVWSRPVGGSGGVGATVVSAHVPDMSAVLRSRRD